MKLNTFPDRCCWITYDWQTDAMPRLNRYYAYRTLLSLPVDDGIVSATLLIAANARYQLWINGRLVSRGPARSYPNCTSYDVVEIADFLRSGENHIAVLVHNMGRSTGQYQHLRGVGLLSYGEVCLSSGKKAVIRTDKTWLCREADWYVADEAMISVQVGFQEHYNGKAEPVGWQVASPSCLSEWKHSLPLGPPNIAPYEKLAKRDIPFLVEDCLHPTIVYSGSFCPESGPFPSNNLRHKFESAKIVAQPDVVSSANMDPGWYQLKAIPGAASLLTLDIGQDLPVRLRIEVENSNDVDLVEAYYDESREPDGRPACNSGFGKSDEGMADSFIPSDGVTIFETFGLRGCRFITIVAYLKNDARIRVAPVYVHYPMDKIDFHCSDAVIDGYYEKSHRTLSTCRLDAYVDTCVREQALWAFDACVQGIASFYTYGDTALLRRCLKLTADSLLPSGQLLDMGPAALSYMILMDQTLEWVNTCWLYFQYSGDTEFLLEIEHAATEFLGLCLRNMTSEDLFIPCPGTWHWLDWGNLDKRPYSLLVNAQLFGASCLGLKIAEVCGSDSMADVCREISRRLKQSLPRFFSDTEKAFLEHIDPDPNVTNLYADTDLYPPEFPGGGFMPDVRHPCSIHSNAVMLMNRHLDDSLFSAEMAANALEFLVTQLDREINPVNQFGPGWIEKIIGPLFAYGRDSDGIRLIKKFGSHWSSGGAPTWPEDFVSIGPYNSAHGWGGAMNTLFGKYVLGITPIEPGFTRVLLDPRPGEITECRGSVRTPMGNIGVHWTRDTEGAMTFDVRTPPGCVCILPDGTRVGDADGETVVQRVPDLRKIDNSSND